MQSCSFINVFLFKKWGFSSSMERWVQAQWPLDGAIWHETVDCGGGSASANIQIIFMFWLIYSVFFSQSCCVIVAILLRVWKKSGQLRHSYLLQKYIIILHIKRRLFTFNYFTGCFFCLFLFVCVDGKRPWTPHHSGLVIVMWRRVMWCSHFLLIWSAATLLYHVVVSWAPRTANMLFGDKRRSAPSLTLLLCSLACWGCLPGRSGAAGDDSLWYQDLCR